MNSTIIHYFPMIFRSWADMMTRSFGLKVIASSSYPDWPARIVPEIDGLQKLNAIYVHVMMLEATDIRFNELWQTGRYILYNVYIVLVKWQVPLLVQYSPSFDGVWWSFTLTSIIIIIILIGWPSKNSPTTLCKQWNNGSLSHLLAYRVW